MEVTLNSCMTRLAGIVLLSMATSSAYAQTPAIETRLEYLSVDELNQRMDRGQLNSVTLVRHLLQRIERLDKQGPAINAIIELNPDALEIAKSLDRERQNGQVRGPLHGIPVLLKDNIDTSDSMQTSAGSLALVGQPAAQDAFIVQRLRAAGAVVLGKPISASGPTFAIRPFPMAGAAEVDKPKIPICSAQHPAAQVRARVQRSRRASLR